MQATASQLITRLFSFRRRANRAQFWTVVGIAVLVMLPAFVTEFRWFFWTTQEYLRETVETSFVSGQTTRDWDYVVEVYFTFFSVNPTWKTYFPLALITVPLLAALARRMHDLGRPAWWGWIALFLVFGLEPLLVVLLAPLFAGMPVAGLVASLLLGIPTFVASFGALIVLVLWTANEGETEPNEYGATPYGVLS